MGQTAEASREPIAARASRLYCEDCRYFSTAGAQTKQFGRCISPKVQHSQAETQYAFVAPEFAPEDPYASCTRASKGDNYCGPDAKWFAPIPAAKAGAAE